MTQMPNPYSGARSGDMLGYESRADSITVGQFFNIVYAWMCVGLAVTAVVGWYVAHSPLLHIIYAGKFGVLAIALTAFGIAMIVQSQAAKMSVALSTGLFLLYAVVIGALYSGLFIVYQGPTLVAAFFVTAGTFAAMSLYGFITKRDLTRIGSIAVMLAFGFVVASWVNLWLASNALDWVITYAILVLFVVIIAYKTQQLRQIAMQFSDQPALAHRYAIVGSLVLYIAFMNLFLSILRILGGRRS